MDALTSTKTTLLDSDGVYILQAIPLQIAGAACWGMYLIVFSFAIYHLSKRRHKTRAWLAILLVTILLFAMSTTLLALSAFTLFFHLTKVQLAPESWAKTLFDRNLANWAGHTPADYSIDLMFSIEFLIGDAIVIWRTWVLWQGSVACYFPIFLWLASLAITIAGRIEYITLGIYAATLRNQPTSNGDLPWLMTGYSLSVVTNAVSTGMIAYRAWKYKQSVGHHVRHTPKSSKVEYILALLIESGLIYLCFWGISLITNVPITSESTALAGFIYVWSAIGNQVVGLYPTLIIAIIELHRSVQDTASVCPTSGLSSDSSPARTPVMVELRLEEKSSGHAESTPSTSSSGTGGIHRSV